MTTAVSQMPASRYRKVSVVTCVVLLWFHIQAIVALFQFSWTNLGVAAALYWLTGGLGICMGYHRLLTHRSFKTSKAFEHFLAVCGTLTLQGGPIFWVAMHRLHHQHSDDTGDPHTPRDGGFWAHMGWVMFGEAYHNDTELMARYAPDLGRDPFYRWLSTYHWVPLVTLGVVLLAIGGWGLVNWAIFLRVVAALHSTWLTNSASHIWGRRRFATQDDSRNNWWVAMLTFGEGWHNNHHAHPTSARHGLARYEVDVTWLQLELLKMFRLVWDVRTAQLTQQPGESAA